MPGILLAERLAKMTSEQRRTLAANAARLREGGGLREQEATEALDEIARFEIAHYRDRRMLVGSLAWEPFDFQRLMRGFDGDRDVAAIEYTATHTGSRKEVFRLHVLGVMQPDLFHHVDEARAAGSQIYSDRKG
jgi:hypothetical protein